jgi:hypothetical protein
MKYSNDSQKEFIPWQPSTWPKTPDKYNREFQNILETIFKKTLILEIRNVINDAPTIEHRGHVITLSILCAIDALSSYACSDLEKVGLRYKKYIKNFFPKDYKPYAKDIYDLHRNSMVHNWNLFEATILPGDEKVQKINGVVVISLENLFQALNTSINNFLKKLTQDQKLQELVLTQYKELKSKAQP